jgi:hypothetical protein
VVGYSLLMGEDEASTLARLTPHWIEPSVTRLVCTTACFSRAKLA